MFLEYVGILHQEERSGRAYRNTWTIWTACQYNSDVSSSTVYRQRKLPLSVDISIYRVTLILALLNITTLFSGANIHVTF